MSVWWSIRSWRLLQYFDFSLSPICRAIYIHANVPHRLYIDVDHMGHQSNQLDQNVLVFVHFAPARRGPPPVAPPLRVQDKVLDEEAEVEEHRHEAEPEL